jgi:hypothetical protein
MNSNGRGALTFIFGALGVIAPAASIHVAKYMPGTSAELASFNSMTLMILSVMLMVFLAINCLSNYNENRKQLFLAGLFFLFLSFISFSLNLILFLTL